jgi:hypothetical protein
MVRPALIVVFLSRPNGEVLTAYAIHLLDAPLTHVLKRLRIATALRDVPREARSACNRAVNRGWYEFELRAALHPR